MGRHWPGQSPGAHEGGGDVGACDDGDGSRDCAGTSGASVGSGEGDGSVGDGVGSGVSSAVSPTGARERVGFGVGVVEGRVAVGFPSVAVPSAGVIEGATSAELPNPPWPDVLLAQVTPAAARRRASTNDIATMPSTSLSLIFLKVPPQDVGWAGVSRPSFTTHDLGTGSRRPAH